MRELVYRLYSCILILFSREGGRTMMAMLWAQKIILGKKTFADVPRLLKEQVKEILIESGLDELITDEKNEK